MRGDADLIAGTAWSLAAGGAALAGLDSVAARVTLGLPFVLFWPGYSLAAALFPQPERLHASQRIAISVGLSIGLTVTVGFALNYSPWGVRLTPIVCSLAGIIVLGAGTAAARRWLGGRKQAAREAERRMRWSRGELAARAPGGVLLVAAAGFAVALYLAASSGPNAEQFTEFYVLGADGTAAGSATHLLAGESVSVVLGLVNEEGAHAAYRIVVRTESQSRQMASPTLRNRERWERAVALAPAEAGRDQDVQFLLYKDGGSVPYRQLHLRLVVQPALATQTTRERATAAPAVAAASQSPAASAPEAPPAPRLHMVSAGENLTFIARDYGVPLSAVIAANSFENPDLIYPQQQIAIPGATAGAGE